MLYLKESICLEAKSLDGFWKFCADKANVGEQNGFYIICRLIAYT